MLVLEGEKSLGEDAHHYYDAIIAKLIDAGDGNLLKDLREATKHTVYAQVRTSNINGLDSSSKITHSTAWWENALTGTKIVAGVLTAGLVGLYAFDTIKENKKEVDA